MKQGEIILRTLEPSDAENWLTQNNRADDVAPIFSQKVFLGKNDAPENWREITETEKVDIEKAWEEKMEENVE